MRAYQRICFCVAFLQRADGLYFWGKAHGPDRHLDPKYFKEVYMIEVTENPIETGKIYEQLSQDGVGSIVMHFGIVKPVVDERKTSGIRLLKDGDVAGEMKKVEHHLREKWKVVDVLLIRRIGELHVGDVILVAAVSSPSKDEAFGACQEAVEALKKKRGLRKEELFEN